MEWHTLQSDVAGKGHPAGQQLWHLKLLVLELAGEWGKQPPRSYWGSEVVPHPPMVPLKRPAVRPLPQSTASTPALYCARNATISICTLPFPCRLLCHGQLRELGRLCERGRGYGPALLYGEHRGSWTDRTQRAYRAR